jgi:hypothetical protein
MEYVRVFVEVPISETNKEPPFTVNGGSVYFCDCQPSMPYSRFSTLR